MSLITIRAALEEHLDTLQGIIPAVSISSVSIGPCSVFTTATNHNLRTGMTVTIFGCVGYTPNINNDYTVIVLSFTTFTLQNTATKIPLSVIIGGSNGSVQANLKAAPNVSWQGIVDVPYMLLYLLPSTPDDPTQGGGYRKEQGTFQITLAYPLGIGTGAISERAELIRNAFPKGLSLVKDGITVIISRPVEIGPDYQTADNYCTVVRIAYWADIFS